MLLSFRVGAEAVAMTFCMLWLRLVSFVRLARFTGGAFLRPQPHAAACDRCRPEVANRLKAMYTTFRQTAGTSFSLLV